MEPLSSILILDDIENLKRAIKYEITRIKKYKSNIRGFKNILNRDFEIPISSSRFKNKISHIDLITFQNDVYLCLNIVYSRRGKPKSVESATQSGDFKKINKVSLVRTLAGKRFRTIDAKSLNNVKVVEVEKMFAKPLNIKLIENAHEKFAMKKKILSKWNYLLSEIM